MTNLKKDDIVMATDKISNAHKRIPEWYPAPGTVGTILDASDEECISVQWTKESTSKDDIWYVRSEQLRKLTKRDTLLFVKYYDKYTQTTTESVKQYYNQPSKAKQNIEANLLDKMKSLGGYGYRVLGGNSHRFIAAFMVGQILYVYTSPRLVRVDTVFAKMMSDKHKEKLEELQSLTNDAMTDVMRGDD